MRQPVSVKALATLILLLTGIFLILGWNAITKPPPLTPWAPIAPVDTEQVGCLNVVVAGVCLPVEVVQVWPDGPGTPPTAASLPTMHVPRGGPFPDFTVKTQRCATEQVDTSFTSQTLLVVPSDGTFDPNQPSGEIGFRTLLKGCTPFAPLRSIGPQQQVRIMQLAEVGVTTTVWQVQGQQTPLGPPPAGTYIQGVTWQTQNYAVVYGS